MFEQVRCCHLWITLMKQRMTLCLYLLRHTFLILFGRKTYFRRHNKVKSDGPEDEWSLPLFALIMLKREREHSGYSKAARWKSRGQKDRVKKKKIQVLSAFDCSCVHFVHIYTTKVIQMKKNNPKITSLSRDRSLSLSQGQIVFLLDKLVRALFPDYTHA